MFNVCEHVNASLFEEAQSSIREQAFAMETRIKFHFRKQTNHDFITTYNMQNR